MPKLMGGGREESGVVDRQQLQGTTTRNSPNKSSRKVVLKNYGKLDNLYYSKMFCVPDGNSSTYTYASCTGESGKMA